MNYRDNVLLNWFLSISFTSVVEISPNSNLLVLTGNDMQMELIELEAEIPIIYYILVFRLLPPLLSILSPLGQFPPLVWITTCCP